MTVYFLRHAEAVANAVSDHDRHLTSKGTAQAEKVAAFCRRSGISPDLIISSPVVRALETARIVAQALGINLVEERWLACGMDADELRQGISPHSSKTSLLLVGHEPDFSQSIAELIGAVNADAIRIRKASLTAVELSGENNDVGQLQFSLPVRLM